MAFGRVYGGDMRQGIKWDHTGYKWTNFVEYTRTRLPRSLGSLNKKMKCAFTACLIACLLSLSGAVPSPAGPQANADQQPGSIQQPASPDRIIDEAAPPEAFNTPWATSLPYYINSKTQPNTRLVVQQYGESIITNSSWASHINDAFAYMKANITARWGPTTKSQTIDQDLREYGGYAGDGQVALDFVANPKIPISLETAIEMLDGLWDLYRSRAFVEIFCYIQINEADAGALILNQIPSPPAEAPVHAETWQKLLEEVHSSVTFRPWPAIGARIQNPTPYALRILEYGENIPTDYTWRGYIQEAFEYMGDKINDRFGPAARSHEVDSYLQEWGGEQRVELEYHPGSAQPGMVFIEGSDLRILLDAMLNLFSGRRYKGLGCAIWSNNILIGAITLTEGPGPPFVGVPALPEKWQRIVDEVIPPDNRLPWPPAPYKIPSIRHHGFSLQIAKYGVDMTTDATWRGYIHDAFGDMYREIHDSLDPDEPSHLINSSLRTTGGGGRISLEFQPAVDSGLNMYLLSDALDEMWFLFEGRVLKELYCYLLIGEMKAASLILQLGPGVTTFRGRKRQLQPLQLPPGNHEWPPPPIIVPASPGRSWSNTRLVVDRYGENFENDDDWRSYIGEAFEYMKHEIEDDYANQAPSHTVDEEIIEFGGRYKVQLTFTPRRDHPTEASALIDLLDKMKELYNHRPLRELFCHLEVDGTKSASLSMRLGYLDHGPSVKPHAISTPGENLPWPPSPWLVPSQDDPDIALQVASYGRNLPTTRYWPSYVDEAFEFFLHQIEEKFGRGGWPIINEEVREVGGDERVVLLFTPGKFPVWYHELADLVNEMWELFTDRRLRELDCNIQKGDLQRRIPFVTAASVTLRLGRRADASPSLYEWRGQEHDTTTF